ncbi:MAG: tRNA pseudouridine(55) synthase TruB [Spirochaetia bacterium]|nr:tRNA pseudouridine(55) synthase TruB [Spirochaetia bacterium]
MAPITSLLLVDKPVGVTSFSSLSPIKREIERKVGHAGTLDKFAHGLMIVLTGNMTKLNTIFSTLDKKYRATFEFGKITDTLDPEGEVTATGSIPTLEEIQSAIDEHFIGPIDQIPPKYSAIHVNGKRAYSLVRAGKEVELISREITIYSIEIIDYEPPFLTLTIHCSKGTYIRSLARDIAAMCGTVAYVSALERTHIGPYCVTESVDAHNKEMVIESVSNTKNLLHRLGCMGTVIVSKEAIIPLSHGNLPKEEYIMKRMISKESKYAIVESQEKEMLAIVNLDLEDNRKIVSSVAILK